MYTFLRGGVFISLGYVLRSGIAGSLGNSVFSFLSVTCPTPFFGRDAPVGLLTFPVTVVYKYVQPACAFLHATFPAVLFSYWFYTFSFLQ